MVKCASPILASQPSPTSWTNANRSPELPAYMSPEQLEGQELTIKSDFYSLGLVLYELFTGKKAFEATTLQELIRLRRSDTTPTSPSQHVPELIRSSSASSTVASKEIRQNVRLRRYKSPRLCQAAIHSQQRSPLAKHRHRRWLRPRRNRAG